MPGDLPDAVAALLLDFELTDEERDSINPFWLLDLEFPDHEGCPTWRAHSAVLLPYFVRRNPGRRPSRWWLYDAPRQPPGRFEGWWCDGRVEEPRLRLGGTGTAAVDVFHVGPVYRYGIPAEWLGDDPEELAGQLAWCAAKGIDAVAIDPDDPPRYESQASYLRRFGLFMRGEEKRLPADAFEPERVEVPPP